jgi:hypothetical protein
MRQCLVFLYDLRFAVRQDQSFLIGVEANVKEDIRFGRIDSGIDCPFASNLVCSNHGPNQDGFPGAVRAGSSGLSEQTDFDMEI